MISSSGVQYIGRRLWYIFYTSVSFQYQNRTHVNRPIIIPVYLTCV